MDLFKKIIVSLVSISIIFACVFVNSSAMVYIPPNSTDDTSSGSAVEASNEICIADIITTDYTNSLIFVPVGEVPTVSVSDSVVVMSSADMFYSCKVNWDNIENIDTSLPDRIIYRGDIIPPEGYVFTGDIEPVVEIVIIVYDEESGEPNLNAEYSGDILNLGLAPLGCDLADYMPYVGKYVCKTEFGDSISCEAVWENIPSADTVGNMRIKGRLVAPKGIYLENDEIYANIYIMKDDDIYTDYTFINNDFAGFRWIKEIEDYENIVCEYSVEDGVWLDASDLCFADCTTLYISLYALEPETDYKFRIHYNGKTYGDVTVSGLKVEMSSGDRDMGDNSCQTLPSIILTTEADTEQTTSEEITTLAVRSGSRGGGQSKSNKTDTTEETTEAATYETEVKEEKNTFVSQTLTDSEAADATNESISSSKTVVSGERLQKLADIQGEDIAFEKDGIMLSIPSDIIEKENIKPDNSFSVQIEREGNKAKIDVRVNDEPIKNMDGAKLTTPSGETKNIAANGEYTLKSLEENEDKPKIGSGSVIVILCVVFASMAGGVLVFICKRK